MFSSRNLWDLGGGAASNFGISGARISNNIQQPIKSPTNNNANTICGGIAPVDSQKEVKLSFEELWNSLDDPKPVKGMNKSVLIYQLCLETFRRIKIILEQNLNPNIPVCKPLIQPPVIIFKDGTAESSTTSDPTKKIVHPVVNLEKFDEYQFFPNMKSESDITLASKLALAMPAHPELLQNTVNKIAMELLHDNNNRIELDESHSQSYNKPQDNTFTDLINRTSKITMQFLKECFGDESMPKTSIFNNHSNVSTSSRDIPIGMDVGTIQRRAVDGSVNGTASPPRQQTSTADNTMSNMSVPPPPPPGDPFDCNACRKPMTLQSFRVRCAECDDFDLCQACFCEGREVQHHKKEHYYIPIGPNQFSLFDEYWTADEELSLLDAIGKFGFGNWLDVSKTVNQETPVSLPLKDKEACEKKYADFHLHGIDNCKEDKHLWPLSSLLKEPPYTKWNIYLEAIDKYCIDDLVLSKKDIEKPGDGKVSSPTHDTSKSPTDASQKKPTMRIKHALIAPVQGLPPKVQVLGYCGRRGDFEIEYENQAEFMIADIEFKDDESPMETEAKLKVVQAYNVILDERMNRKRLMLDKRIYDQKYQTALDRLKTSEQKALNDLLKPIWKYIYVPWNESEPPLFSKDKKIKAVEPLLTEAEIDEFIDLIMEDRKLIERLDILTAWQNSDLKTVQEVLEKGKSVVDQYYARKAKEAKITSLKLLGSDTSTSHSTKSNLTEEEFALCRDINLRDGLRHGFIEHLKKMLSKEVEDSLACNVNGLKKVELAPDLADSVVLNDFSLNANIEALSASAVASSSGGAGVSQLETLIDDHSSLDGGENADSLVDGGSSLKAEPSSSDVGCTIPRKRRLESTQVKDMSDVLYEGSFVGSRRESSSCLDNGGEQFSSHGRDRTVDGSPQLLHDEGELRTTAYSSPNEEEPAETEEGEIDDEEEDIAGYSEDGGNSSLISNKYNSIKSDTSQYEEMLDGESNAANDSFQNIGNFAKGESPGIVDDVIEKNDFSDCGISFENLNDQ